MFEIFRKDTGDALREGRLAFSDEEGTVTVFSLFLAMVFAMVMGMAIDVTIAQYEQARLQATADRAALAAADIDQSIAPLEVVESYFETAGLLEHLDGIELPAGSNGPSQRRIKVKTSHDVPTAFMHLLNMDYLKVSGDAEARDAFSSVEVSLVLDISGSMRFEAGGTPRIDLLKPAAVDFVKRVLGEDNTEKVTISLVPYAGQVNPGARLFQLMGGTRDHSFSSCLEITSSDFAHIKLPSSSTEQVPHFMNWTVAWDFMDWGWCPMDGTSILPLSNDADGLEAAIKGMRLHDGTGTAYAMKWGLALLDPDSRDTITTLREEGIASPISENRPADYEDDVRKIVVLMTDGKITEQVRPIYTTGVLWADDESSSKRVDPVAELVQGASVSATDSLSALANLHKALADYTGPQGESDIVIDSPLGSLLIHSDSEHNTIKKLRDHFEDFEDEYDVTWNYDRILNPLEGEKAMTAEDDDGDELTAAKILDELKFGYINHADLNIDSDGEADGDVGVEMNNQKNHRDKGATNDFRTQMTNAGTNVNRFETLCTNGKNAGVEIFTIAFMAPGDAQTQMKGCASDEDTHYFEVNEGGKSLAKVFNEIAASISELRLTQ